MLPEKTLLLQIEAVPAGHVAERADRLCYDGVLWFGVIVHLIDVKVICFAIFGKIWRREDSVFFAFPTIEGIVVAQWRLPDSPICGTAFVRH